MNGVHRFEFKVSRDVIDGNGHMNNVAYVRVMQDAAVRHADRSGCTAATVEAGATWFIRSHFIEYLLPAFLDDPVTVLTWVSGIRGARSFREYRFLRAPDGALLARGKTEWVFIDAKSGRPRRIPDRVKETFPLVPEDWNPPDESGPDR
jgi:acyl-CoA thioester hydrolase